MSSSTSPSSDESANPAASALDRLRRRARYEGTPPNADLRAVIQASRQIVRRLRLEADDIENDLDLVLLSHLLPPSSPFDHVSTVTSTASSAASTPGDPSAATPPLDAGPGADPPQELSPSPIAAPASSASDGHIVTPYTGKGEEHQGVRFAWPEVASPLTPDLLRYEGPATGPEFATMFVAAPFWRFNSNDSIILRPCRWLPRPQLGVFIRSTRRYGVGETVIRCRTTLVREAGGYDITVDAPAWHRDYQKGRSVPLTFYVSASCPSIYLNSGERGWAQDMSNVTWEIEKSARGEACLVVQATKPLDTPYMELLVPYGWSRKQWAEARGRNEMLMVRCAEERELGLALPQPAKNINPYDLPRPGRRARGSVL